VDLYVSYAAQPSVGDRTRLARGSARTADLTPWVFTVDGRTARPYGVYTFTVSAKRAGGGEPAGRSLSGVVRGSGEGGYGLSIYENDVSPSSSARLTVRNASAVGATWRVAPNSATPAGAADERSGSLAAGEWQIARDVAVGSYLVEFLVDGERVAMIPHLELAAGRNTIVYLVGEPGPAGDREQLLRPVAVQELPLAPGPADPHVTTPPAPPVSAADEPAAIVFDSGAAASCDKPAETTVSAFDPDGVVKHVSIDGALPDVGDVELRSLVPSAAAGAPAAAELSLKAVPDGAYRLALAADGEAARGQEGCTMRLKVKPLTIQRVHDQVAAYRASGDVEATTGDDVTALLDRADAHVADGDAGGACVDLNALLNTIRAQKGSGMSDAAADALLAGVRELRADLGC
jgi:hypothetical protein